MTSKVEQDITIAKESKIGEQVALIEQLIWKYTNENKQTK